MDSNHVTIFLNSFFSIKKHSKCWYGIMLNKLIEYVLISEISILESKGLNKELVDKDGFPRQDLDFGEL